MQIPDIHTARLRLVTITPALLELQENNPETLATQLNATLPQGWPGRDWEPHVYAFMRTQFQNHPHTIGWHRYVLLPEGNNLTMIGTLGSHPKGPNEAEIGYGIVDAWQNNGYATEATRALLHHLFSLGQERIRAQTFPHLAQSLRVMQKCGMKPAGTGEEPGAISYAIDREDFLRHASVP